MSEVRLEGLSLLRTVLEIRSPIFEAREYHRKIILTLCWFCHKFVLSSINTTSVRVQKVSLRQLAKFRGDRSNHCGNIAIYGFLKWQPWWFRSQHASPCQISRRWTNCLWDMATYQERKKERERNLTVAKRVIAQTTQCHPRRRIEIKLHRGTLRG